MLYFGIALMLLILVFVFLLSALVLDMSKASAFSRVLRALSVVGFVGLIGTLTVFYVEIQSFEIDFIRQIFGVLYYSVLLSVLLLLLVAAFSVFSLLKKDKISIVGAILLPIANLFVLIYGLICSSFADYLEINIQLYIGMLLVSFCMLLLFVPELHIKRLIRLYSKGIIDKILRERKEKKLQKRRESLYVAEAKKRIKKKSRQAKYKSAEKDKSSK